jgi:predicted GIY-YIG superfamily endonuclease
VTVYLLHFDAPVGPPGNRRNQAWHYTGSTRRSVTKRLAEHAAGKGARLLAVALASGVSWQLARTWEGGRDRERQIKRQGGASRRCPLCGVHPRPCPPAPPGPDPDAFRWYWAGAELPGSPPRPDLDTWPEPPY